MTSLNSRTLGLLDEMGYTACVAERYNPYTRRTHDLFGIIDIVAVGHAHTIGVQLTSGSNVSGRRKKIRESAEFYELLEAGWHVEVWGWAKVKNRWTLTHRQRMTGPGLKDFDELCHTP